MIVRTYIVKMPTATATEPLDILVQNAPGSQSAPTVAATDGAYYETLGRPFRIPVLATGASGGTANGFVPPTRLGFSLAVTPIGSAQQSNGVPAAQLSASLAALASTDAGPTINVPAFADPAGGPSIRLTGGSATAGGYYIVSFLVAEAKDTDRSGTAGQ